MGLSAFAHAVHPVREVRRRRVPEVEDLRTPRVPEDGDAHYGGKTAGQGGMSSHKESSELYGSDDKREQQCQTPMSTLQTETE
jgi:hypothetical protein